MKIAVVGSGISGLSAAYYLSKNHHVDLFEKEDHFGGHSHTIDLTFGAKKVSVDIGFIVFNYKTYPNLIKFFDESLSEYVVLGIGNIVGWGEILMKKMKEYKVD